MTSATDHIEHVRTQLPYALMAGGAALTLFGGRGVAATSLRELAESVDLHNSTLLHHFRGKSELVSSLVGAVAQQQRELLAPLEISRVKPTCGCTVTFRTVRGRKGSATRSYTVTMRCRGK